MYFFKKSLISPEQAVLYLIKMVKKYSIRISIFYIFLRENVNFCINFNRKDNYFSVEQSDIIQNVKVKVEGKEGILYD